MCFTIISELIIIFKISHVVIICGFCDDILLFIYCILNKLYNIFQYFLYNFITIGWELIEKSAKIIHHG